MDSSFWHQRWNENDIGFHEADTNPLLIKHFSALPVNPGARIFLPLCGKSLDALWLLSQGFHVLGAELSALAVEQLFSGMQVNPTKTELGSVVRYSAQNIDIFVGDIFDVSAEQLGNVDAVYDRAALVALPEEIRKKYVPHVINITGAAYQLLLSYSYDQSLMDGPPFSITPEEVERRFAGTYQLSLLDDVEIPGGLKGRCAATERVWLLSPQE
ncbi:thiopurine S-methyltransferase [Gammaproteobacteria bacterium 45_16_T64]|nr:thiopurine S-methyltransferase [Gammaproteobacteria bacterium 45_16_T64]